MSVVCDTFDLAAKEATTEGKIATGTWILLGFAGIFSAFPPN